MDRVMNEVEYAICQALGNNIRGYRVYWVDVERQYALAERLSDGIHGYLWLWSYTFTPRPF